MEEGARAEDGKDKEDVIEKLAKNLEKIVNISQNSNEKLMKISQEINEKLGKISDINEKMGKISQDINKELVKISQDSDEKLVKISHNSNTQARDWTKAPTYSKLVDDYTGGVTPFEQIGVYTTSLGGLLFAGRSWKRAYHLMRAADLEVGSEDYLTQRSLAWVSDIDVQNAARLSRRFCARGVVVGIGAPLLWLAYLSAKHSR